MSVGIAPEVASFIRLASIIHSMSQNRDMGTRFGGRSESAHSLFRGNYYSGVLNLDDAAAGALVQFGQEGVDLLARLDELDLDGQVVGDLQDVRGVDAMRGAEAGYAFEHGCAIDAVLEQEVQQGGVDGDAVVLGAIAKIDGDFDCRAAGQHGDSSLRRP